MSPSVEVLELDRLLCDPRLQVRVGIDKATVARYAAIYRSGVEMDPIEVAQLKSGALVVLDGFHRVAALRSIGWRTVAAKVHKVSYREARWLAAAANLKHGRPLKPREFRNVFRAYIHARRHRKPGGGIKSYRQIAQEIGGVRSHNTVRNWMRRDFPEIAREMGGEVAPAPGGLRDPAGFRENLADTAREALRAALLAFYGLTDAAERRELIAAAEATVRKMKAAGEWTPPESTDF